MSAIEIRLVRQLLLDHYGEEVSEVGTFAAKEVSFNIRDALRITGLRLGVIKDCLALLYQQNLVAYKAQDVGGRPVCEFEFDVGRALLLLRYPLYLRLEAEMRGEVGGEILRELLVNGRQSMSSCVMRVRRTLKKAQKNADVCVVKQSFLDMVEGRYVERCPRYMGEADLFRDNTPCYSSDEGVEGAGEKTSKLGLKPSTSREGQATGKYIADKPLYWAMRFSVPKDVNLGFGVEKGNKVMKVKVGTKEARPKAFPDEAVEWRYNPYRYHDYYRIHITRDLFSQHFGQVGRDVIDAILKIGAAHDSSSKRQSLPVPTSHIKRDVSSCPTFSTSSTSHTLDSDDDDDDIGGGGGGVVHSSNLFDLPDILDQMVFNTSGMLVCSERSSGGKYAVDFIKVIHHSGLQVIQDVVLTRLGSRASRVFGAFLKHEYLHFDQLIDIVMLSQPKETKAVTYELFENCFLDILETDARGNCLMYVNLPLVTRNVIVDLYQAISNAKVKLENIRVEKKRVLEKGDQLDKLLAPGEGEEEDDDDALQEKIDAVMPAVVRVSLNKARADVRGFTAMMLRSDELILKLQLMMRYVIRYHNKELTGDSIVKSRRRGKPAAK